MSDAKESIAASAIDDDVKLKPSYFKEFAEVMMKARLPFMVKGQPGGGKTEIIKQAAANIGYNVVISHPVVSDATDYKGFPFVIDGKAVFIPFSDLLKIMEAEVPTLFFLDDLGQAMPAIQKAAMQLLLAREINGKKISDLVTFAAATNRKEDKAGVTGILEPVKSRFASIVELVPDVDDWVGWALDQPEIPIELISYIRWRPAMLNQYEPTNEMKNTPSPRTVYQAGLVIEAGMPKHLEYAAFAGAAGSAFAAEFTGFLATYRDLPDPDSILMDPRNARVPENNTSAMYAVCGAIAQRATVDNMENVCTYASRLPGDFSVLMIHDAQKRNPEVCETRAFIKWANDHADIIL